MCKKTSKIFIISILSTFLYLLQIQAQPTKPNQLYQTLAEANSDSLRIMAMYNLYLYYVNVRVDSALYYSKEAYSLSKKNNDYELGRIAMALGHAYHYVSDYEKSVIHLTEAYEIAKKIEYKDVYALLLSDLGQNYQFLGDYENAMKYFKDALKVSTNYNGRLVSYSNIAQVYSATGEYSKAHEYYNKALEASKKEGNIEDESIIYNRLGELYMLEKGYDKAIGFYEKSLKMMDTIDVYYKVVNYNCLAEANLLTKNYVRGIEYATLADSLSFIGGFIFEQKSAKSLLSELYENMEKPIISLKYYKEYADIKDSIINTEKNDRVNYLHVEFQTKEKELQLEIMQKEAALKNKMLIIYGILSLLVVVILLYLIKNIRLKNKKLKFENEKETFLKQKLELELHQKKRELLANVMQISQQKEILQSIQEKTTNIIESTESKKTASDLQALNREIKAKINQTDGWRHIKMHFENVHPQFFKRLKRDFPTLSPNDLKLCAYAKLNLNGKEVSQLLNINPTSVQMARYRLKKKMNIEEEVSLDDFILSKY